MAIEAPRTPELMNETFANAFNTGDIEILNSLFEKGATVVRYDKTEAVGEENYTQEHRNLLKIGGVMQSNNKYCVVFEDIALLSAEWVISTIDEEGQLLEINGTSTEVLRKQKDGTWLYIIDNPYSI